MSRESGGKRDAQRTGQRRDQGFHSKTPGMMRGTALGGAIAPMADCAQVLLCGAPGLVSGATARRRLGQKRP